MPQVTNLKLFGIDESEYLLQNAETLEWLKQGAPRLDIGMYEILMQFNAVEGVTTRWCCAGHEHEGDGRHTFYIMFTLTERGQHWLEYWFKSFMTTLLKEIPSTAPRTELTKTYRLKRDDAMHEVMILKTKGLKTPELHTRFLELVKQSFSLIH